MRWAAVVIVVVLGTGAHAEEPDGPKEPEVATWLSISATAASYAAVGVPLALGATDTRWGRVVLAAGAGGTMFAPSLGQVYAEQYQASGPLVVRILALPMAAFGVVVIEAECENVETDDCPASAHRYGTGVIVAAGAMYLGATIWELFTVGNTARRYNRQWRDPPVTVVPTPSGLAVTGRW